MSIVNVRKEDLDKFKPIQPTGWYSFIVKDMVEKTKPDSINFITELQILGPQNVGRSFDKYFNSKGGFVIAPFVAACSGQTVDEMYDGKPDLDIDPTKCVGMRFDGELSHRAGEDGKTLFNDVREFAPFGTMTSEVPFGG